MEPLDYQIQLPSKKHGPDAGYDLQSHKDIQIPPLCHAVVRCGWNFHILEGWYGQIKAKSRQALNGLGTMGGVIDSGYEGEV